MGEKPVQRALSLWLEISLKACKEDWPRWALNKIWSAQLRKAAPLIAEATMPALLPYFFLSLH